MTDRSRLWLAATHAAHSALEAIGLLYSAAGASSIYANSPLDRCLRDARTAVQHICTQEVHFELAGRHLLGRDVVPSIWAIDDRGDAAT
jgi:alkylation response protein AidB-like acyl-CoA dehydrogenase